MKGVWGVIIKLGITVGVVGVAVAVLNRAAAKYPTVSKLLGG